ncbi:MAG: DNA polymerase III subunit gamma/tau [Gammaproteobacteria bacterium HGW-Gammaproteobacteria-8]|nr:MAG: DNA polymerase III subunit gamma/tau [Gammaproteobacteria bacterium HGW-Gammaproteobacteria-8]
MYLIDEVHMLSTHSFNALLKTLEEPPEHVKFVLATTDPQKIPVTILSRCLQFNLRRLGIEEISGQLKSILEAERLEFEVAALALLARAADGSMRDGLSLLDQALAAGGGRIELEAVEDMLGTVEQRHLHAILEALVECRPAAALSAVAEVFGLARDLSRLLSDLAEALHRIALIQQLPDYRDESRTDWEQLSAFASKLDPEDVQLYYQIAVTGRRDLGLAPSIRSGCEMTLLRMFAFKPADPAQAEVAEPASRSRTSAVREPAPAQAGTAGPRAAAAPVEATEARPAARTPAAPSSASTARPDDWASLLQALDLNGPVRAVAAMMELASHAPGKLEFRVAREDLGLLTERFRAQFSAALERHFGEPCRVDFRPVDGEDELETPARLAEIAQRERQAAAEQSIAADPLVHRLQQDFGAEVIAGSVRSERPGSMD